MKHTVDASGKTLGRLASETAMLLMGKTSPDYRPNVAPALEVLVTNFGKVRVTGAKMSDKLYWRFSRYPGGLKHKTLEEFLHKDPEGLLKKVVGGMLPKNKLRPRMLKHLKVIL